MLATIQRISSVFKSRRDGGHEVKLIRDRFFFKNRLVYLEELELERERWRLRPGDLERERRRTGDRLLGERDLSDKNINEQSAPNKNKTSWNNTQG